MKFRAGVSLALVAVLAMPSVHIAQTLPAQIQGSWDIVKALPFYSHLIVKTRDQKTIKGSLVGATDLGITIVRSGKTTEIGRNDIMKITLEAPKSSRKKSTLIGLAAGASLGAAIGGTQSGQGEYYPVYILGFIGAFFGAAFGFLLGFGKERSVIYETR